MLRLSIQPSINPNLYILLNQFIDFDEKYIRIALIE